MLTLRSPYLGLAETRPSSLVSIFQCPTGRHSRAPRKLVPQEVMVGLGTLGDYWADAGLGTNDQQRGYSQRQERGPVWRSVMLPRPPRIREDTHVPLEVTLSGLQSRPRHLLCGCRQVDEPSVRLSFPICKRKILMLPFKGHCVDKRKKFFFAFFF